ETLVDAPDELAADPNPAPRGRLAEASAHGRRAASRVRLDPAGDDGDHGVVSMARAGDSIVPGRGDVAPRRPYREHDAGAGHRPLPQGTRGRVPGGRDPVDEIGRAHV